MYETALDTTAVIKVLDAEKGRYETVQEANLDSPVGLMREAQAKGYARNHKGRLTVDPEEFDQTRSLMESGVGPLTTFNFPDYLRMGIQFDMFTSYNELPVSYPSWARVVDSNKQYEEYVKDSALGLLPTVLEGQPYPNAAVTSGDGVIIRNYKRGLIIEVTEEMQKFDQVGKVRELGEIQGRAARLTEEIECMNVITTSGNYTRNSTTNDNDEGANQASVQFSPTGLITAFNTLMTMKDRTTGVKINVMPNTLIIGPKLRWAAEQLIRSPQAVRVGGGGTAEVYGTGEKNAFFNVVSTIIVSPHFSNSYNWCLMESGRAVTFQRVEPLQLLRESMDAATTGYFERDVIRYRVRTWFGVGMRDDRFAFLSTSSSAPIIN